jgi:hypothetical protein
VLVDQLAVHTDFLVKHRAQALGAVAKVIGGSVARRSTPPSPHPS